MDLHKPASVEFDLSVTPTADPLPSDKIALDDALSPILPLGKYSPLDLNEDDLLDFFENAALCNRYLFTLTKDEIEKSGHTYVQFGETRLRGTRTTPFSELEERLLPELLTLQPTPNKQPFFTIHLRYEGGTTLLDYLKERYGEKDLRDSEILKDLGLGSEHRPVGSDCEFLRDCFGLDIYEKNEGRQIPYSTNPFLSLYSVPLAYRPFLLGATTIAIRNRRPVTAPGPILAPPFPVLFDDALAFAKMVGWIPQIGSVMSQYLEAKKRFSP